MGLAVAKGRAQESQGMLQARSHTQLHFQAQASLSFHKEPVCYSVTTVTSGNCMSVMQRDAGLGTVTVLNLRACPALREGTRKRNPTSEPGTLGWESVGSQLVCQGSGCRGWELSTGTAGSGHSSTLSPGMAGAALAAPTDPPLHQPSQTGPSVAQRGSQNRHWLWGGQGSRDPDTHGHPLLLLPSQELLAKPQAPAGHSSQGWIHV